MRINLNFKGDRNYLHGTDIFNETLTWLSASKGEIEDIDFSFHRLASCQLMAMVGSPVNESDPVAVCSYTSGGIRGRVYLTETDQVVTGRYPYPEENIVSRMEVNLPTRRGVLHGEMAYSDIETWVAMTKSLHHQTFPQLKGQWLFVRGRFTRYVRHTIADERALVIAASLNDKLTRSEALLDGIKVGEIYFSIR